MKEVERDFEKFVDYLEAKAKSGFVSGEFADICSSLGISENVIGGYITDNFGVSGQNFVKSYHVALPIDMML